MTRVGHRDPVGELIGFFEILGGEENGHVVGPHIHDHVTFEAAYAEGRREPHEALRAARK
jgi:hypothetical protein